MSRFNKSIAPLVLLMLLEACTPMVKKPGPLIELPRLTAHSFITADGTELPLSTWRCKEEEQAILIALHGFNDYRKFFQKPGEYFAQQGFVSFAYDQRGFGATPQRGYWAGRQTYTDDLATFTRLIKARHPEKPVFLLGESMGGAVVINSVTEQRINHIDGIILAAPAVWGRKTMPWYQTALLWSLSHSLPWLTLTGEGLEITPSDNIEMLKALSRDPLVIKETRVDTIYGLTNLMDQALDDAQRLTVNTLLLYGEKDEIIPQEPTLLFLRGLLNRHPSNKTVAFYQDGYHMLLRDLQAPIIWQDIAAWIKSRGRPLPSGADIHALQLLNRKGIIISRK